MTLEELQERLNKKRCFYTKEETNQMLNEVSLKVMVEQLPDNGTENYLYLVPSTVNPGTYEQYIWEDNNWQHLGNVEEAKLTDFVTEPELRIELDKQKTYVEVTWLELKNLRDTNKLIPGAHYRITDYITTTTQTDTNSAGHQFDIIVLALSENKLAEEGWAMEHPTDVYDVTFADGVTKKCYIYKEDEFSCNIVPCSTLLGIYSAGYGEEGSGEEVIINDTLLTATTNVYNSNELGIPNLTYNYFQNSNLSAWKVWYCLDNDTNRFAWADAGSDYIEISVNGENKGKFYRSQADDTTLTIGGGTYELYAWKNSDLNSDNIYYTWQTKNPTEDSVLRNVTGAQYSQDYTRIVKCNYTGRGVIYRLIDEFNNDIKYDFKNIQFKRTITDGHYDENGNETLCYTLNVWHDNRCKDASIVGNTLPNDEGFVSGVYDNIFGYTTVYNMGLEDYNIHLGGVNTFAFALGNNVILSISANTGEYYGIYSNTIGDNFHFNTIGDEFYCNIIGNEFHDNIIGNLFRFNTIGNGFTHNTINNRFDSNMIGNWFSSKQINTNVVDANYGNSGIELATKS